VSGICHKAVAAAYALLAILFAAQILTNLNNKHDNGDR